MHSWSDGADEPDEEWSGSGATGAIATSGGDGKHSSKALCASLEAPSTRWCSKKRLKRSSTELSPRTGPRPRGGAMPTDIARFEDEIDGDFTTGESMNTIGLYDTDRDSPSVLCSR